MRLLKELSDQEIIQILRRERSALGMISPSNDEWLVWTLPANLLSKGWKLTSKYSFQSDHVFVVDAHNKPIKRINFDITVRDKHGKPVDTTPEIRANAKDVSQNMAQARLAGQTKHKQKKKKKQSDSAKAKSAYNKAARKAGINLINLI